MKRRASPIRRSAKKPTKSAAAPRPSLKRNTPIPHINMKRALAKKKEYEAYLRSPEWDAKRALVLERDGHRCVRCGSKRKLQVHHKTYARFKEELLDDLETLCGGQAGCHKVEHRSERWKNQRRAVVGKA